MQGSELEPVSLSAAGRKADKCCYLPVYINHVIAVWVQGPLQNGW